MQDKISDTSISGGILVNDHTLAILSRMVAKFISRKSWVSGINLQNVVIVGPNKRAVGFAPNLEPSPRLGYRVMGFAAA